MHLTFEQNNIMGFLNPLYKTLDDLCICPKRIIYTYVYFFCYMLSHTYPNAYPNTENLFKRRSLAFSIRNDGRITTDRLNRLNLSLNGKFDRLNPNCSDLYRFLNSTNLENCLFDCLNTVFRNQNNLFRVEGPFQHELLYVTIEPLG